jgi:hypothetical protein
VGLLLIGGFVSWAAWERSFHAVAWPDECIYLVGARNVIERGTLDTSFYLTYSLLRQGYPHRDPHMPGYTLALSPFVAVLGPTLAAAGALNILAYLASILLVFDLASQLLANSRLAALAAALFAVLPPLPGYLFVAYAEPLITFLMLATLALSLRARGWRSAAVAGLVFGLGCVVRETLLAALPLHVVALRKREVWRGFLPGLAGALLVAFVPLSRNRAQYPGGYLSSVLAELQGPDASVGDALSLVATNLSRNLSDVVAARPASSVEDATLLFFALLACVAALSLPALPPRGRRLLIATLVCFGCVVGAAFTLYVVRARQGTWAGVRTFMPWSPLLLVFAAAALARLRSRVVAGVALLILTASMLWLDAWQAQFFYRYKQSDHEDEKRRATYVESRLDGLAPTRVVGRLFLYGYQRYPVEVIWSLPRDGAELRALERALPFGYVVINWRSPLRAALIGNPRYYRLNKDDRDAELLIWRRLD